MSFVTTPREGVHYYGQDNGGRAPTIFRTTVVSGVPHDEGWSWRSESWVPTQLLWGYRVGRGDGQVAEISEREALALIQGRQTQPGSNNGAS